jgi:hypothetical protein
MLVQQGTFTIHADANDLSDVEYSNHDGSADPPRPWRRAFGIPARGKKYLRGLLHSLGINKSTLFPDLAALAEELKDGSYGMPRPT